MKDFCESLDDFVDLREIFIEAENKRGLRV